MSAAGTSDAVACGPNAPEPAVTQLAPPRSAFVAIGCVASGVVFAVFLYLVVYLQYVARVRIAWDVYAPRMIPTATAAGVVAALR